VQDYVVKNVEIRSVKGKTEILSKKPHIQTKNIFSVKSWKYKQKPEKLK
jgi:hypothetical protein